MTQDMLVTEVNYLIEQCLASQNRPNAARRLLAASNLIRHQWELAGNRDERKRLLGLMSRLVIRAGELLGDTSQEHAWLKELEEEAAGMKAAAAGAA